MHSFSIGYDNPLMTRALTHQVKTLQHCTTMFFQPLPANFAEELTRTMPASED